MTGMTDPKLNRSPFTAPERDLLRRELCRRFGQGPSITDGIFLRTWRTGEWRNQPKIPCCGAQRTEALMRKWITGLRRRFDACLPINQRIGQQQAEQRITLQGWIAGGGPLFPELNRLVRPGERRVLGCYGLKASK